MSRLSRRQFSLQIAPVRRTNGTRSTATLLTPLFVASATALAQGGSPFDTGFTAIQTLFTGTVAKVASLVAIVIGGYGFAHGCDTGAGRDTCKSLFCAWLTACSKRFDLALGCLGPDLLAVLFHQ
jgi:type IV secretory pathway VirB2 component (pilin)